MGKKLTLGPEISTNGTLRTEAIMNFFAYVDPGAGLLVWQMIAAACVGCLFYLKKFREFVARTGRKLWGGD